MSNVTLFGFPRSTFVKVAGLILTARNVDYRFHDTEDEMYLPLHLERHPFGRVPALQHDDFMLYETSAIAAYVDDVFPGAEASTHSWRRSVGATPIVCSTNLQGAQPGYRAHPGG
jgi:glutathione S-transferase